LALNPLLSALNGPSNTALNPGNVPIEGAVITRSNGWDHKATRFGSQRRLRREIIAVRNGRRPD
jgi:hypothetical protein